MPRLIWVFAGRTCHCVGFVMRWLNYLFGWLKTVHARLNDANVKYRSIMAKSRKNVFGNLGPGKTQKGLFSYRLGISDTAKVLYYPGRKQQRYWSNCTYEPRHDKTNKMTVRPAKTHISLGIHPVWSESSLSAWRKLWFLVTHWAHSKDSDQTGRMPRLIWVFAGHTYILLVLSCRGSYEHADLHLRCSHMAQTDFLMTWLITIKF